MYREEYRSETIQVRVAIIAATTLGFGSFLTSHKINSILNGPSGQGLTYPFGPFQCGQPLYEALVAR